nr:iron hydrogenase small subunit [Candidatus Omnitrophota bacterium]
GGGQPVPTTPAIREARTKAIYAEDKTLEYRKSHDNPIVKKIYEEFFTEGPCGALSHKLLHTNYLSRGKRIDGKQKEMNAQKVRPTEKGH